MAGKAYDPEIWFYLKAIWQAIPKISFAKLCALVEEITGKKTPSVEYVTRKAKSEKWTKNIRAYCRKADRTLENCKGQLFEELKKEFEELQKDKQIGQDMTKGTALVNFDVHSSSFDNLEQIAIENRKTITVLMEHRRRLARLGQLTDESMEWIYEAKVALETPSLTDEDKINAERRYRFAMNMVDATESFSRTAKNLASVDFVLYGITPDQTKTGESNSRMAYLDDDTLFDKERLRLEEEAKNMAERADFINSGEFERTVKDEMEERMRALEEAERQLYPDDDDDE